MTGFELTQRAFASALRAPDQAPPVSLRSGPAAALKRRFNVYRNNVYAGLIGVLEARYPAVQRLLGQEFFRAMARIYIDQAPPRSPVLLEYGGGFSDFLKTFDPVVDEPYLPDVALLEWKMHHARHAAETQTMRASDFAGWVHATAELTVRFVPAVSLVSSAYPVFSLWQANASVRTEIAAAYSGAECVLVTRPALTPEAVRIPRGSGVFIARLLERQPLGAAAGAAFTVEPDFPLSRTIALLVAQKAIASVTRSHEKDFQP